MTIGEYTTVYSSQNAPKSIRPIIIPITGKNFMLFPNSSESNFGSTPIGSLVINLKSNNIPFIKYPPKTILISFLSQKLQSMLHQLLLLLIDSSFHIYL